METGSLVVTNENIEERIERVTGETGIIYDRLNYVRFSRRMAIGLIDFTFVTFSFYLLATNLPVSMAEFLLWTFLIYWIFYFAFLKTIGFRTLGYRLMGAKIIDYHGNSPALWKTALRCLVLLLGPAAIFFDLAWSLSDEHRQTLRDKLSETFVVKHGALPIGTGTVVIRYVYAFGYTLLLREVENR